MVYTRLCIQVEFGYITQCVVITDLHIFRRFYDEFFS